MDPWNEKLEIEGDRIEDNLKTLEEIAEFEKFLDEKNTDAQANFNWQE